MKKCFLFSYSFNVLQRKSYLNKIYKIINQFPHSNKLCIDKKKQKQIYFV